MLVDYNTFDIKDYEPEAFFNSYSGYSHKFNIIFSNPAVLKVFALQCDLFSMGKIYVYKNGKAVDSDPALDRLSDPNPLQSQNQLLWDFMFWNMVGVDYVYVDSNFADNEDNKLYVLDNRKIKWPQDWNKKSDKLIFSKASEKELLNSKITYEYNDGTSIQIPLSKIICITDLTNGLGDFFSGQSRIDALYKVISNNEETLDATNINTRFTGKFIVSGQADPTNVTQAPMGEDERLNVEQKMNGRKKVYGMKSMVDIKRFIDNLKAQGLDERYLADYFIIGNMYNIPKDVLDAGLNGSTYENQEKSTGKHVSYTLQPKADEFTKSIGKRWGYKKKEIAISWDHLPFMQVFEKERAQTKSVNAQTFVTLLNNGVSLEEANKYLDLEFTTGERQQQTAATGGTQNQSNQSATQSGN